MAYVKFIKGTTAQYESKKATYTSDGSVFFATNDDLIFCGGRTYGLSAANKSLLDASIKDIAVDNNASGTGLHLTITYTDNRTAKTVALPIVTDSRDGLMSAAMKGDLDDVKEQVITGGSGTLKNQVAENKVGSTGKTITVTPGSTATGGAITGTNLEVNIDNTTIVKDSTTGVLSVASSALTQYVGDSKAIEVSAADGNNNKTISLKVKSGDQVLASDSNGLSSTIKVKALTTAEVAALSDANVKEAYKLVGIGDAAITGSDTIKIYKDSSLLSVALLHADLAANPQVKPTYSNNTWTDIASASQTEANLALCFAYQLADGSISVEAIPVGAFLRESEFGNGLKVTNGVVSVKLSEDSGAETFLSFGTDGGVKVSGIQDAIDKAAAAAKTEINTTVAGESASHLTITKDSTAADGHDKYSFTLADVASEDALDAEVLRAKGAETAIDAAVGLTKANDSEARTYTPESGAHYGANATTIADRLAALDTAINTLSGGSITNISVNGESGTVKNGVAAVTIDAEDTLIDAEGTSTDTINTGGIITKGTSVKSAIQQLEAQLLWYQAD